MSRLLDFLKRNKYFLLAHHPKCDKFQDDTIQIKNTQLCIGCFVAIPMFFITLTVGVFSHLFPNLSIKTLRITSGILTSGYLIGKIPFKIHKIVKIVKIVSKGMVGTGGAFLVGVLWHFPFSPFGRFLLVFVILEFAFLGHGILRAISIYRTCNKCPFHFEWKRCPGMNEITSQLDKGF